MKTLTSRKEGNRRSSNDSKTLSRTNSIKNNSLETYEDERKKIREIPKKINPEHWIQKRSAIGKDKVRELTKKEILETAFKNKVLEK